MEKTLKIGLALSGGAARGLAHIGVIETLEENGIPIDFIAGSSMGALIGGLYAASGDIRAVKELAYDVNTRQMIKLFDIKRGESGFISGDRVEDFLSKVIAKKKIEDFKIPFTAIATDLTSGKEVNFSKGDAIKAIRSSISIPVIFKPVEYEGMILVDGDFSNPLPTDVVKKMGANFIIGVELTTSYFENPKLPLEKLSMASVFYGALSALNHKVVKPKMEIADAIISPNVFKVGWMDFRAIKEAAWAGRAATEKILPEMFRKTKIQPPEETLVDKFIKFLSES
ncbi:MAG: patatin-like phospholipase family protein [Parcubacteria group bacterium]|nr:patatin-like phospholipase family protein [Parcubacteria group bacterium]